MIKHLLLIAVFCLLAAMTMGQASIGTAAGISGHLYGRPGDTVLFSSITNPAAYMGNILTAQEYKVVCDSNGSFSFRLPAKAGRQPFITAYWLQGDESIPLIGSFIQVDSADYISIAVHQRPAGAPGIVFSGKGCRKYECVHKIDSCFDNSNIWAVWKTGSRSARSLEQFKKTWKQAMHFPALTVLDEYRRLLRPAVYRVLKTNIQGRLLTNLDIITGKVCVDCNKLQQAAASQFFLDTFYKMNKLPATGDALKSPTYFNYLMASVGSIVYLQQPAESVSLSAMINQVKKQYSGQLREYLLTAFLSLGDRFSKPLNNLEIDSLWQNAYGLVKTPVLKAFLNEGITRKQPGADCYPFSLVTEKGDSVRLADLQGKVVLVDFWFTGCTGCVTYSANLEKFIYPYYKNNPGIVFLSVSGDKSREKWLHSITTGKYTRMENINTYTGGLGFDDPFCKYYSVNGGPCSLIIDSRGKIYICNPATRDMDQLKKTIDAVLVN